MEKKWIVVPWISLVFLLLGMLCCFASEFSARVIVARHILPGMLIAGGVLFVVLELKKKYAIMATLIGVLGLILLMLFNIERLQVEFQVFTHYINRRSIAYNGTALINMQGAQGSLDHKLLLNIFWLLVAAYISFFAFRLHSRFCGFLPVFVVPAMGMCVGVAPDKRAVLLTLIGIVMALAWLSYQDKGGRHSFWQRKETGQKSQVFAYVILTGFLAVGLLLAQCFEWRTNGRILSQSRKYLKWQHTMESQVNSVVERAAQFVAGVLGMDSDGALSNERPYYLGRTVLKVTLAEKPDSDIYFKGFVGGDYYNGHWSLCETEKFQRVIADKGWQKDVWNAAFLSVGWEHAGRLQRMEIEHFGMGQNSKYAYIPYYSDISIKDQNGKECISVNGENGLLRKGNIYYVMCYTVGEKAYEAAERESSGWSYLGTQVEWADAYHDYIQEVYSGLPENRLLRLKEFVEAYRIDASGEIDAACKVRDILHQNAEYSMELEPLPFGQDYAEYFLLRQHKGYCEHFATTGTLMLRACGVPARYVSGYRISPDRFEENSDGTYTARVLDSDAHAWTEVFAGRFTGWFPVEMTPAAGNPSGGSTVQRPEITDELGEMTTAQPTPGATEPVKTESPKQTPQAAATAKAWLGAGGGDPEGDGRGINDWIIDALRIVVPCAAILFVVIACRLIYLRFRTWKYGRNISVARGDENITVLLRLEGFLYYLSQCGVKRSKEKLCGEGFELERWERAKEIVQKAGFSKDGLTAEEYEFFCDTVRMAEYTLYGKLGKKRRNYLRLIGIKLNEGDGF